MRNLLGYGCKAWRRALHRHQLSYSDLDCSLCRPRHLSQCLVLSWYPINILKGIKSQWGPLREWPCEGGHWKQSRESTLRWAWWRGQARCCIYVQYPQCYLPQRPSEKDAEEQKEMSLSHSQRCCIQYPSTAIMKYKNLGSLKQLKFLVSPSSRSWDPESKELAWLSSFRRL